jgi:nicotinamide-nucleotide amidase
MAQARSRLTRRMVALEIVTIGTELMLGHTTDTNGAWLGARLAAEGITVARRTAVADDHNAMNSAICDALARTHLVICTGGLGPTTDDFTKQVAAAIYNRDMVTDAAWLDVVRKRFTDRGLTMPAINHNQAEVPAGATLLPNPRGSAPGIILDDVTLGITILLPGVPSEMRGLTEEHVIPLLRDRFTPGHPIVESWIRTNGISESALAERVAAVVPTLAPLAVSFLPSPAGEDIRITCWGDFDQDEALRRLQHAQDLLAAQLQPHVYALDARDLADIAGTTLRDRGLALALAESCTGGLLAQRITAIPGASEFFLGATVAYANEVKLEQLGVRPETSHNHGAVSTECAREMAIGALRAFGADIALSITGIAGPGGGTAEKPVGTVCIGIATHGNAHARLLRFGGDRDEIRMRASQAALALLLREVAS